MMMSPDGSKVLVQVEDQGGPRVFLVEDVPKAPNGAAINATNPAQSEVPVRKVTGIGGEFATWTGDSRHIYYALGHSLFTYDLERGRRGGAGFVGASGGSARAVGQRGRWRGWWRSRRPRWRRSAG